MTTITGATKVRVDDVEAEIPVSAAINSSGHLIVTKHDTTTTDFGALAASSTTQPGIVELSTDALAIAATDTVTAVTPHALGAHAASIPGTKVQNLTAVIESSAPSVYPVGITVMEVTGWSLNSGNGTVVIVNIDSTHCQQTFYSVGGGSTFPLAWVRTYNSTWTAWVQASLAPTLAAGSYSQSTVASGYPVGESRLQYTTVNAGSWDFTGKGGEVWTYSDGSLYARQVYTRLQGGTPSRQEMWLRTSDFSTGWTAWRRISFEDVFTLLASTTSAFTSTAQTAATGLASAVEASATYLMEAWFLINSTVSTADTAAISWTGPSGATMQWGDTNATSDYNATIGAVAVGDATLNIAVHLVMFKGVLKTSSTAGNLTPTFGVSATTTSPSYTVLANSYVRLTRIA